MLVAHWEPLRDITGSQSITEVITMPNGVKLVECEKEFTPVVTTTTIKLAATVYEAGGNTPASIIREDQAWYAIVEWEMTGDLIRHFCGKWKVSINLESIGPFPEYAFGPETEDMNPCGDGKYSKTINVPAGAVDHVDDDGTIYILGVTLGSIDPCGDAGHIYAHCTGGELQFVPGPAHT
jgi:hypothetical protein